MKTMRDPQTSTRAGPARISTTAAAAQANRHDDNEHGNDGHWCSG